MTLEEKDRYIEEKLMQLEPDTLRYMVVDFMAALEETTTLRDQFAMAALTGLVAHSENFIRHGINTDTLAIYSYKAADAMLEARAK